jgi:LemA protein
VRHADPPEAGEPPHDPLHEEVRMNTSSLLFLGALLVVAIYAVMLYNSLVRLKHGVSKAWSNIDVLLKQRHDELPKLVETCKQYMQFEQKTLQGVVEARSRVQAARERQDIGALGRAEGSLHAGIGQLLALAEGYPELRANENFMQLQHRITGLENTIADRREYYNEAVNLNNVRVEEFPTNLVARVCAFGAAPLLAVTDDEKADPDVRQMFA